jgi:hypothetical protein
MSCVKKQESIDKKQIYIDDLKEKLDRHKLTIAEFVKEIAGLKEELEKYGPEHIKTSVDLTPYFHKLDRIAALTNSGDMETFLLELNNFKTMLSHIKMENADDPTT